MTILLFDLPTQLYVCNQYLSKVFAGSDQVIDYRKGREVADLSEIKRGCINILPHWKFPILKGRKFDLLWNAASFQEMGAETAKSYLDDGSGAKSMYLMYNIKYAGSKKEIGNRGVIDPSVITRHKEISRTDARLALKPIVWLYCDSWWQRASCRA